jgi:hypothetical protein
MSAIIQPANPAVIFITRFINQRDSSITAATEPVLGGREIIDRNDNFSTSPKLVRHTRAELENESASTSSTYPAQPPSWTALFTHSMSVLSGSGEVSTD